ncbi:MAG: methylated-DNA--[protein]-cysteine S-methyltransferase [Pseudomonadota bacterium]
MSLHYQTLQKHEQLVKTALEYINQHWQNQPSLDEIATATQVDPFQLQRIFSKWVGLSPKKMVGFLTLEQAKSRLRQSQPVLEAAFDSGLSGAGRLHDLFIHIEHMSPGEYKRQGEGLEIYYQYIETPFGEALVMETTRGICGMAFTLTLEKTVCFKDMCSRWPKANYIETEIQHKKNIEQLFQTHQSFDPKNTNQLLNKTQKNIPIFLMGTGFQIKVWEALMRIPPSYLASYGHLCEAVGLSKSASRAIGSAIGKNPISWIIPCHRVIRQSGWLGGYRWGLACKIAMLNWEQYQKITTKT